MNYNLNIQGNKNCRGNEGMIRKNIKDMEEREVEYLKNIMQNLNDLTITKHALEKNLITLDYIQDDTNKQILKKMYEEFEKGNRSYKIIDYNYNMISKEERIMFRTKNEYEVKNNEGITEKCYCKIVISITNNCIITTWMNRVSDEKMKQNNLKNRYISNFDIINKKVKF